MKKGHTPEWVKKVQRNAKARERYFIKRYGTLDRMRDKDDKFLAELDELSFEMELEETNQNK